VGGLVKCRARIGRVGCQFLAGWGEAFGGAVALTERLIWELSAPRTRSWRSKSSVSSPVQWATSLT